MHQTITIRWALLFVCTAVVTAADLPRGHADFMPSRERPVGWRGDLSGYFPAAKPTLDFSTGVQEDGTQGPSKNIIWKTVTPNWASSGCIVVGDKVITRASPSTLLAYDANTGKLLWHNPYDVFDYHFKDDPAKAKEMRQLWQKVERQRLLGWGEQGKSRARPWTIDEREEWIAITTELLESHPQFFGKRPPAFDPEEVRSSTFQRNKGVPSTGYAIPEFRALGLIENKYLNSEDRTISTPLSDGEWIWVANGSGLATCHAVKDGSLRWATWRGHARADANQSHGNEYWPSPWLHDKKLIICNDYYVWALDPDTGKEHWRFDLAPLVKGGKYDAKNNIYDEHGHTHAVNCGFLTVGTTPIIITGTSHVIRATDGVLLHDLQSTMWSGGGAWVPTDDNLDICILSYGQGSGGGSLKDKIGRAFKFTETKPGEVAVTKIWESEKALWSSGGPAVANGAITLKSEWVSMETGETLKKYPRVGGGTYASTIATEDLVFAFPVRLGTDSKFGLGDLREPTEFIGIEQHKQHGGKWADVSLIFTENEHLPLRSIAKKAHEDGIISWLNVPPVDYDWANNLYGSTPFLQGKRMYVRSRAMLYCIGEE